MPAKSELTTSRKTSASTIVTSGGSRLSQPGSIGAVMPALEPW